MSGVAQKGPLQQGSTVTAQALDANLAPTGQQFTYQITSNLGTFLPNSSFGSRYIGLNATGYYFDEVVNGISLGTITLNGYSDLAADSVLNVNVLTTLAHQRIQRLVQGGTSFFAARDQAEREVLEAFSIPSEGAYGSFSTLDLSRDSDGDHILAALSSLLVYGNTSGTLSALIASIQSDIGQNGAITDPTTIAIIRASAAALDPSSISANLTAAYSSVGLTFSAGDISAWIDRDGDGLAEYFQFQVPDATQTSTFVFPSFLTAPYAGTELTVSLGIMAVNGTVVSSTTTTSATDAISVSPPLGTFPGGVTSIYLLSDGRKIGRVSFVSGLQTLEVTPVGVSIPVGLTQQMVATGTFTDGSTADLTTTIVWTSSAPSIAAVTQTSGVATGTASGTATITATSGAVTASTMLNVVPAVLSSITVTPNPIQTGVGISRTATAQGLYSDGSASTLGGSVTWSSASPSVAQVAGGLVTGVAIGSTTATASLDSISTTVPVEVTSDVWVPAASLPYAVGSHTATLLQSGRVLVVGGIGDLPPGQNTFASAQLYDPGSDTWTAAADLPNPRSSHAATLMNDGRVLIVGGYSGSFSSPYAMEAYVYDPASNTWASGGNTIAARVGHTATLLPSGMVLVAGGIAADGAGCPIAQRVCAGAELYDPTSNTWSLAASMNVARSVFTATALSSGKVLVAGGGDGTGSVQLSSAEIYDPNLDVWMPVNSMNGGRSGAAAALLDNGTVLVAGSAGYASEPASSSAEVFDPIAEIWSNVGSMTSGRGDFALTVLPNGKVLATGGYNQGQYVADSEIYDPLTTDWSAAASLLTPRYGHSATKLFTGPILVTGGTDSTGHRLPSAELYW